MGCGRTSDPETISAMFKYLSTEHSPSLLEHVVNLADGNVSTVYCLELVVGIICLNRSSN